MRKGQAAFEYMSTIGIAMLILLGLVAFAYSWTASAKETMRISTADNTVHSIVESANLVYAQGYPAKTTIIVQVPDNIEYFQMNDNEISIRVNVGTSYTDVAAAAKANLTGTLPTSSGYYKLSIQALENLVNVSVV